MPTRSRVEPGEFDWQARPGDCELLVRATDDLGNVQPEVPSWNELGYLNGAIVAHPVRSSEGRLDTSRFVGYRMGAVD